MRESPGQAARGRAARRARWWWLASSLAVAAVVAAIWAWQGRAGEVAPAPPAVSSPPAPAGAPEPGVVAAPTRAKRLVRGRVLGLDGAGLEGISGGVFRVGSEAWTLPRRPDEVWHSGADGHFSVAVDHDRDLAVAARGPGMISPLVAVGDGRRELMVRMVNAYDVRGYVSVGGFPVADCEVVLQSQEGRFARVETTDANGAFRFAQVLPGQVSIEARSTRFRPAKRTGVAVGSREAITLEFRDVALGVQGRALLDGPDAQPAKGAQVRATALRREGGRTRSVPHVAMAREDGTFELFGLGPGPHRVEVAHEQRSTVIRQIDVEAAVVDLREVRLPDRALVRGRLLGDGPIVTELLLVTEAGERASARTDTAGRFEFTGTYSVGPATLALVDRSLGFERSLSRRLAFDVGAGEPLSLNVVPALLLLGEVVDTKGRKVSGAEIYVDSDRLSGVDLLYVPAALTDADGQYRLHVASTNNGVELTIAHPAHATSAVQLPRQASGVQQPIVLAPPRRVRGVVRRNDKPLPAAIVHLGIESRARAWAATDPDGVFVLHDVPPGAHSVFVRYGSLGDFAVPQPVLVAADRDTDGVSIDLPTARTVEGRVVDPQGQPVAGALVSVQVAGGGAVPTDPSGNFRLDAPQGEVEVRALAPEWRIEATQTVGPNSGPVRIALPLPPHGRLLARLQGLPDRRPTGCILRIAAAEEDAEGEDLRPQWVDAREGELNFARFPTGQRRVEIVCSGYAPFAIDVAMAVGEVFDAGRCVLEPGSRVRGRVVDAGGRPVPGARVVLGTELDLLVADEVRRSRGEDVFGTRADARGRFELHGVTSRSATLVVAADGFAPLTRSLAIPGDVLGREEIQIQLGEGVAVIVEVTDAGGQPLRGTPIDLRKDGFSVAEARTDGQGQCVFPHLAFGDYEVQLVGLGTRQIVEVSEARTYHVALRLR